MKACANLQTLFSDLPLLDRFAAAEKAGFRGVELPFPYDSAVPELLGQLGRYGLSLVMIACPPPNYTGAARGFAAGPGGTARFRQDFKRTLRYAKALGAAHVHVMSGVAAGPEARETLIANLRWALAEGQHQHLTIEPMSQTEVPGYYLNNALKAYGIVKEINHPRLGLQFDVSHIHAMHSDVLGVWADVADRVHHIQIAQAPNRSAPLSKGEIDVSGFLAAVARSKYKGWIAAEYTAHSDDPNHMAWLK